MDDDAVSTAAIDDPTADPEERVATDARFERAVLERLHPAEAREHWDEPWLLGPQERPTPHASELDAPERRLDAARHDAAKWGAIGRSAERWAIR